MFGWLVNGIKKAAINLAADYAKQQFKVARITNLLADTTTTLLTKATSGGTADADKLKRISATCKKVSYICAEVAGAIEDGKVTLEEMNDIIAKLTDACASSPITDDVIAGYIDAFADKVKGEL